MTRCIALSGRETGNSKQQLRAARLDGRPWLERDLASRSQHASVPVDFICSTCATSREIPASLEAFRRRIRRCRCSSCLPRRSIQP